MAEDLAMDESGQLKELFQGASLKTGTQVSIIWAGNSLAVRRCKLNPTARLERARVQRLQLKNNTMLSISTRAHMLRWG
jgi:hypothetical protein